MTPDSDRCVSEATRQWISKVVVGFGFCPFAGPVLSLSGGLGIDVLDGSWQELLEQVDLQLRQLEQAAEPETLVLVIPKGLESFETYLDFLHDAESLLQLGGYEGVLQLASFHPEYCFAGAEPDDVANYTNRSPYPMLHVLREDSITRALSTVSDPQAIPERNMVKARALGAGIFKDILAAGNDSA